MKSAASAATKQLRWQLLEMFPQAPMKVVSDAAKTGDLATAIDIIAAATGCGSVDKPSGAADSEAGSSSLQTLAAGDPAKEVETLGPAGSADVQAADVVSAETVRISTEPQAAGSADMKAAMAWLEAATDICQEGQVDANAVLQDDSKLMGTEAGSIDPARKCTGLPKRTEDGWEIKCAVDETRPCQSLRTRIDGGPAEVVLRHVGQDNTAAFGAVCFEQMLQREQELEGEFCVFYHSYNAAALMYEVEAEIARYAFNLPDKFAPLPRVIQKQFLDEAGRFITLEDLKASLANANDHLLSFRALAISASPTLFAFGSEAPPLSCFRHGYHAGASMAPLIQSLLGEATGAAKVAVDKCYQDLLKLAHEYGISAPNGYGGSCGSGKLGGQMLQIFIHRSEVDEIVYNSLPFGVPVATPSVERWLTMEKPSQPVDGQVRILMRPEVFLDESRGRIFHYCADWEFLGGSPDMEGSRAAFVLALRRILEPLLALSSAAEVRRRLTGQTDEVRRRAAKKAGSRCHDACAAKAVVEKTVAAKMPPAAKVGGYSGDDTIATAGKRKGKKR